MPVEPNDEFIEPHSWHRWPPVKAFACLIIKIWLGLLMASLAVGLPILVVVMIVSAVNHPILR